MQKNILKKSKRFAIFFVFFILLAHVFAFVPSLSPQYVRAAEAPGNWVTNPAGKALYGETIPVVSLPIGEFMRECNNCAQIEDYEARDTCYKRFTNDPSKCFTSGHPQNWLGQYILAWFNYLIGAIGIIAVVMIMWGGIKWITAGGNASQVDDAKGKIKNAVMGIVLLLCTYTIFKTINPRMLSLQLPTIETVKENPICCKLKANPTIKMLRYTETCSSEEELVNPADPKDLSGCKQMEEYIKYLEEKDQPLQEELLKPVWQW